MKKRITVLGSTGSIGTQTLEVIGNHPEAFELIAITAGKNIDLLIKQALKYLPQFVVIADEEKYRDVDNNPQINCFMSFDGSGSRGCIRRVDLSCSLSWTSIFRQK